jgi:hypothetical protein
MATRPKSSIAEQLGAAQVAIMNALADQEIQAMIASHGYTIQKLQEGRQLYETAAGVVSAQVAASGAQAVKTQDLHTAERLAFDAYQSLTTVARAVFRRDQARLVSLGLNGPMPRTMDSFLKAAYILFDNVAADPQIKSTLAAYGYDEARVQAERGKIVAYDTANQQQEAAKGTAQQSTRDQKVSLRELNDWVSQFIKIARVALKEKKELLERLGVLARSVKTEAQRAAPEKAAATRAKEQQG